MAVAEGHPKLPPVDKGSVRFSPPAGIPLYTGIEVPLIELVGPTEIEAVTLAEGMTNPEGEIVALLKCQISIGFSHGIRIELRRNG